MRRTLPPLVAAGLFFVAAPAAADRVESTRGAALRLEHAQVDARQEGGMVHFQIRYEVVNPERRPDEAQLELALPPGAVVTGMRYRMSERGGWIAGRLVAAASAEARFNAYSYGPFVAARGAALLTHDGYHGQIAVSYVPPRGRIAIAYDVAAPACFARGHWIANRPAFDPTPRLRVSGGRELTGPQATRALGVAPDATCSGFMIGPETKLIETAGADDRFLVFPHAPRGIDGTMVTVAAGATAVTAIEVVTPDELVPAPRGAAVVFVVDASRSMADGSRRLGDDGIAAQLAVIRAYLAQVPDARFDVVVYRRRASRLFGTLVPAAEAARRLAALAPGALAPGNGSHLDAGLALAAEVLARASGPRRLIAFTDDRTRVALETPVLTAALAALPADAIAHIVIPSLDDDSAVARLPEHRFSELAGRWGGIFAEVTVGADPAPLVELVRPLRIEGVQAAMPADPVAGTVATVNELGDIEAGMGLRQVYVGARAPVVTGWIWGRRWTPTVTRSRVATTRVARLALGEVGSELDDAAVAQLAALGTAATRTTSFLADDPRWTPGGLPADEFGMSGRSYSSSCGWPNGMSLSGVGTIGHGSGTGTGVHVERPAVAPLLEARVAACAAPLGVPWATTVAIETTGVEIVDVTVTTDPGLTAAQRGRFDECVTDAAWALTLDARFARYTSTFTATFAP